MTYFYDGGKQGFLTALALSFRDKDAVLTAGNAQLSLGQQTVFVSGDPARAAAVEKRLLSFDKHCMKDLDLLLRSGDEGKDGVAFAYFRLLAQEKRPVRDTLALPAALAAAVRMRRVGTELHRMRGFLRFMESASGALYAPCSPDNDLVDLLLPHFRARLPRYPFVIHDVKRKKAAVYDGAHAFNAPLAQAEVLLSADEQAWQELWRKYYKIVNIPERERLKQMRGYLPVRYRKFMNEFFGENAPL